MNRSDTEKKQAVTLGDCERRHRNNGRFITVVLAMMTLLTVLVGFAASAGLRASQAATVVTERTVDVEKALSAVSADLKVHEARQNGSLESIQSQLATLRTYHSTIRGELKEQRKLLDELLRKSGDNSS